MNVWLIDEGTPGHTVQTAGLGEILRSQADAQLEWLSCRLRLRGWMRPLARWITGRAKSGKALDIARAMYPGLKLPENRQVDLIVSSCGKSAYLNRLLCSEFGAHGIFIGEIKPFPAWWFDLIVTPVKSGAGRELLVPIIEAGRTPESGAKAAADRWGGNPPTACWTLLIGGNSRTHPFDEKDWLALAEGMTALAQRHGIRWLVSTSRRTGPEAERLLQDNIPSAILAEAVWYGSKPEKVVGAYLAVGERLFVTQDSLTMMSEGLAMGKRVELLRPRQWDMPAESFNGRYVARLSEDGLIGATDLADFPGFIPAGDGRVSIEHLRAAFAERLLAWVKENQEEKP